MVLVSLDERDRAATLAAYHLLSYLSMSPPAIAAGAATQRYGLGTAAHAYAVTAALLAVAGWPRSPSPAARRPAPRTTARAEEDRRRPKGTTNHAQQPPHLLDRGRHHRPPRRRDPAAARDRTLAAARRHPRGGHRTGLAPPPLRRPRRRPADRQPQLRLRHRRAARPRRHRHRQRQGTGQPRLARPAHRLPGAPHRRRIPPGLRRSGDPHPPARRPRRLEHP
ncbi:protein of unknown function (plasmid) [Streptantibioticus cattleyicolor NRRL 8057 = DSM 46488]|nr:protein of unknown function [Streptantibioticus cattleyicolor NRRL 8057 = DSM 46488]